MSFTYILASQSPRRKYLLGLLGQPIVTQISGAVEDIQPGQDPVAYVEDVARRKAKLVAHQSLIAAPGQLLIIAADTTVVADGMILGKPSSADEARVMLQLLRNRTHLVHTGLCVIDPSNGRTAVETHTAAVTMRDYSDDEIQAYVATGDPLDKAGAYGIQNASFRPVARLDGCFLGVMGLSLCHLTTVLRRFDAANEITRTALEAAHEGYPCPVLDKIVL